MPEFLKLLPPEEAMQRLLSHLDIHLEPEWVSTTEALGRVTYEPVHSPQALPAFPRSTVDGYAVRAIDTHGASESLPAYLRLVGEVTMGAPATIRLQPTECALIHTGGMLPEGADAVVMLEYTQPVGEGEIEVQRAVVEGENVLRVGEDVAQGQLTLPKGVRLRPAEIGGLMGLGITRIQVVRRPQVGILSSGDELIPPDQTPAPGQIRDINSYSLAALVTRAGGIPRLYGILPDHAEALEAAAAGALAECDLVVITAGSSASQRDLTAEVVGRLGEPGVLVHGVNVRPGKPTILAMCDGKPVVGLPGNPVSALVIAGLFVVPLIQRLVGLERLPIRPKVSARLALNIASLTGREDWVPVKLERTQGEYVAHPVFFKSNLIFRLAEADGLLRVPPEANGLNAGELVEVYPF